MANIYKPELMEVIAVRQQTIDVKSVALRFLDAERARTFSFQVGQFGIFSVFGYGESTFNICSSSNWKDRIEFCFRKVGRVTEAMWKIEVGDVIGFRGPYGNGYPWDVWKGHDLIFLGGGIAMPPIPSGMPWKTAPISVRSRLSMARARWPIWFMWTSWRNGQSTNACGW
jgi:NAD(P)H-flavin reductase